MMHKFSISIFVFFMLGIQLTFAKILLPGIFTDNMVLQQNTNAPIWGWCKAGQKVVVKASWLNRPLKTVADDSGNWSVGLETPSFGGPYYISIQGENTVTLRNVLIGEVWLCSGQSNMEMPLAGWGKINNYRQEIANADYPNIRLFQVERAVSTVPKTDVKSANGGWTLCEPSNISEFSATAYFFARELYKKTGVPIGLIHSSWGGTLIEAWTSANALKTLPEFAKALSTVEQVPNADAEKNYRIERQQWINLTEEKDDGYKSGRPVWLSVSYETNEWQKMALPSQLEQTLPDFDGVIWLHKKVKVPEEWAGKPLKLGLGPIDDADITWFNGKIVGQNANYNSERLYNVPGELVKEGENDIVVRVLDTGGGGGLYGDAALLYLQGTDGQQKSLSGVWDYRIGVDLKNLPPQPVDPNNPSSPSGLFNGMIYPFIKYAIKGAIWYQGEANAERGYQYRTLFPLMIKDWRSQWNIGDFPFYFVQLANYNSKQSETSESDWAELREAQLQTLSVPKTGMAVAIDIGNFDIHPKNKQEIGRRLALIALARNYHKKIDYSGPIYKDHKIKGDEVHISFKFVSGGLKTLDGQSLTGFSIAGEDHQFHWADAKIIGDKVVVRCAEVSHPVAVRYGWATNPDCNLYNTAGLPASPFRTDEWKGISYGKK